MRPLANNVLLRDIIPVSTPNGIQLPEQYRQRMEFSTARWCDVIAVGPGRKTKRGVLVPIECRPGHRVLVKFYEQPKAVAGMKHHWIVDAGQILAVEKHSS